MENKPQTALPLVVDLDGTLIHTDMLHETALGLLRDQPLAVLRIPGWLCCGKAALKQHLASRASFLPERLPYNAEFLDWLKEQKALGRKLVLCTAADHAIAMAIAVHLQLFDEVIASDGVTNLSGERKARELVGRYGRRGFDYAGNAAADLAVWQQARRAVVVNATPALVRQAEDICAIEHRFPPRARNFRIWRRVLRVHQWLKNLLLFVPLAASHQLTDPQLWLASLLAFLAFSLCASAVYIANDLLDLECDRQHPRKCNRPFAAGMVPAHHGILLAPLLLAASAALAVQTGGQFLAWLTVYFLSTCVYSLGVKRLIILDCLLLAMLYTLRIVAGTAAIGQSHSFWLLAFSVFLFLSLAFVKRYAELEIRHLSGQEKVHGRGYYTTDAPLVQTLGVTAGYVAVLVLALYLNSDVVQKLYRTPEYLWGAVPVMLFWISWIWMQAHRGNMHDDPLLFAVKDRASLLAATVFAAIVTLSAAGWP